VIAPDLSPYDIGRLAGTIHREIEPLSPACLGNVSAMPAAYPTILRHVLGRARAHAPAAAILDGSDRAPAPGGSFWHGFYAGGRR